MDVGRGEQLAPSCLDPGFASARLTLRAMAIAATVIGDGGTMSAAGALIDMTAECRAWVWVTQPEHNFLTASYSLDLSTEHSVMRRNVLQSAWFQRFWG